MTDRPIIFSAPMIRALLEGRKTQTRRVLNPQPAESEGYNCRRLTFSTKGGRVLGNASPDLLSDGTCPAAIFAPYLFGDRLWVREAWRASSAHDSLPPSQIPVGDSIEYQADPERVVTGKPRVARFMCRWMSRLTLTVVDVRVQRLQEISEEDALAEGVERIVYPETGEWGWPQRKYSELWSSLHGPQAWAGNPWVAAITFDVRLGNIDSQEAQAT